LWQAALWKAATAHGSPAGRKISDLIDFIEAFAYCLSKRQDKKYRGVSGRSYGSR
jgi:hypothetical protein